MYIYKWNKKYHQLLDDILIKIDINSDIKDIYRNNFHIINFFLIYKYNTNEKNNEKLMEAIVYGLHQECLEYLIEFLKINIAFLLL